MTARIVRLAWSGVARGWYAVTPKHTNVALDTVGLFAITRGVLYAFGPQPRDPIPRGLDLLPVWMLYVYGVFWLCAGIFGAVTARGHHPVRQAWARWFLTALCLVWAACYFAGTIIPADGVQIKAAAVACIFYLVIARLAWTSGTGKVSFPRRALFLVRSSSTGEQDIPVFLVAPPEPPNGEGVR